ncbi:MAG: protein translocase subunit SecF [Alphaproteobacteria bacterium]
MLHLRLIPSDTKFPFMKMRGVAVIFSALLVVGSIIAFLTQGLNYGIDFVGGTLIEVRTQDEPDIAGMRSSLDGLGLGEVSLQAFGDDNDVLIRIERQSEAEGEDAALTAAVQQALGEGVELRRVEFVGPKVGGELREAAILAVTIALVAIMFYIWFRFEWQYGVGAIVALAHDVISTIGLFAVLQLEFNLATVAAVLTIAGYSINDTVVVFDRVRENLRKYKKTEMRELLDLSINQTLSRTIMTSMTTLIAVVALFLFGGAVVHDFAGAMIWGIVIGTYSSIFVAGPLLIYMKVRSDGGTDDAPEGSEAAKAA